jgi:L-lactate dehydrogenase complex protein LldG
MTTEGTRRGRPEIRDAIRRAFLPGGSLTHPGPLLATTSSDDRTSDLLPQFIEQLEWLNCAVHQPESGADAIEYVRGVAREHAGAKVLAWTAPALGIPGVLEALAADGLAVLDGTLPADPQARFARLAELATAGVGVTGASAGLADTGSIVLVHGVGRGRLASLLPPVHVALVDRTRIVCDLPTLFASEPTLLASSSNVVVVTGPSRTADIEMTLSRGVHGPRDVHVVLY